VNRGMPMKILDVGVSLMTQMTLVVILSGSGRKMMDTGSVQCVETYNEMVQKI